MTVLKLAGDRVCLLEIPIKEELRQHTYYMSRYVGSATRETPSMQPNVAGVKVRDYGLRSV
jgi:hypothetical protein